VRVEDEVTPPFQRPSLLTFVFGAIVDACYPTLAGTGNVVEDRFNDVRLGKAEFIHQGAAGSPEIVQSPMRDNRLQ